MFPEIKPLADRSKEFWNSLKIWLDGIQQGVIDPDKTEFFLVTNKPIVNGLVFDLMSLGEDETRRAIFVAKLRSAGKEPPPKLKEIFSSVLGHTDDDLKALIARISVIDGNASHGHGLRREIADKLHLVQGTEDEIIISLLGWVHDTALTLIRAGKPALLAREAFDERLRRVTYRFHDTRFVQETEEALIPVNEQDRQERKGKLFVKQLQWLGLEDNDERIIEAIDDHIRSGTEAIKLAQRGLVSKQDLNSFDGRLIKRWKNIKRTYLTGSLPSDEIKKKEVGFNILNATMGHCEPLAGQETTEYYLTQGAYHRLADEPPNVGWHPEYEQKAASLRQLRSKHNET